MSAKWDRDWLRIGRYDSCRRRSTWVRFVAVEGPPWLDERSNVHAIDLCSGREGDDAEARIENDNPAFWPLLDVLLTSAGNVDQNPDDDEWYDDERPASDDRSVDREK